VFEVGAFCVDLARYELAKYDRVQLVQAQQTSIALGTQSAIKESLKVYFASVVLETYTRYPNH